MSTQQSPTPENLTEQSSTVTGTNEQHPVGERPVAIVTGASRGLGNAIARELSLRGYDLVLFARGEVSLEATAAAIASPETAVIAVQGDVANADDRERLIETTRDAFGRIDVLVNNAGIVHVTRYAQQTPVGIDPFARLQLFAFQQNSGRRFTGSHVQIDIHPVLQYDGRTGQRSQFDDEAVRRLEISGRGQFLSAL